MEIVQGYRFGMSQIPVQAERLLLHCGAARFASNTMLAVVKANFDQRTAERAYDIAEAGLTPSLMNWSAFGLQREWHRRKAVVNVRLHRFHHEDCTFWNELHSCQTRSR